MKNRYILLGVFILMAVVQIWVPGSMIMEREDILNAGKTFKFETAPIDPYDPFRGKYITLSFAKRSFTVDGDHEFENGMEVYATIEKNDEGFAEIRDISADKPASDVDCIKVEISSISTSSDKATLFIDYPFDRYYMEEFKAPEAEEVYFEAQSDTTSTAYALVKIKGGKAVLEDVLIDGVSIEELVKSQENN